MEILFSFNFIHKVGSMDKTLSSLKWYNYYFSVLRICCESEAFASDSQQILEDLFSYVFFYIDHLYHFCIYIYLIFINSMIVPAAR